MPGMEDDSEPTPPARSIVGWGDLRDQDLRWLPPPPGLSDDAVVAALIDAELPAEYRETFATLARPAVALIETVDLEATVARFGGEPDLPDDEPWPQWPGHGPLSYVGELFCDRLAAYDLGLPVPRTGRLLFFTFDGWHDGGDLLFDTLEPTTAAGTRVLAVGPEASASPRPAPEGIRSYRERRYAGRRMLTFPGAVHPDLYLPFGVTDPWGTWLQHPVVTLVGLLRQRFGWPTQLVGGYAHEVQDPPEHDVARARAGVEALDELARWRLVLQVEGAGHLDLRADDGALYWLTRLDPERPDELGEIAFVHQFT